MLFISSPAAPLFPCILYVLNNNRARVHRWRAVPRLNSGCQQHSASLPRPVRLVAAAPAAASLPFDASCSNFTLRHLCP